MNAAPKSAALDDHGAQPGEGRHSRRAGEGTLDTGAVVTTARWTTPSLSLTRGKKPLNPSPQGLVARRPEWVVHDFFLETSGAPGAEWTISVIPLVVDSFELLEVVFDQCEKVVAFGFRGS